MISQGRVSPVHHLALRTRNVDALCAFYRTWLGSEIVRDARPRSVWLLLAPGSVLMLEQAELHEPVPDPRSLELMAFAVTAEERVRLRARLVAKGLLEAETEHTLYVRDPEGRRLGFSSYPLPKGA